MKYNDFVKDDHKEESLIQYYETVYQIKKNLHLLPPFTETIESLSKYTVIEKPILLVGNCTRKWIKEHAENLDRALQTIAFGRVYQENGTFHFDIPEEDTLYSRKFMDI